MADKAIQDLPRVDRLEVDDLLVVGDASNGYNAHAATGAVIRILVKEQASEAVAEIESKVSEASQAATSAAESADAAKQYAQNATDSAEQSATSAQQSETSATDAQGYANSASEKATLSQSWAVGGTGSREDEDTNNAKYWAEQAHNAAGGGVVSFNSRTGVVVPQDGDYTPDMVGAVKKVPNPTAGDFPVLTADGHLQGSGISVESVSPEMQIGVEYEMAERYTGKPVYTKLIDCGALPNSATSVIPHGIANVYRIIQAYGYASNYGKTIPTENFGGSSGYVRLVADTSNVFIRTSGNFSNGRAYVTLKYAKTTD